MQGIGLSFYTTFLVLLSYCHAASAAETCRPPNNGTKRVGVPFPAIDVIVNASKISTTFDSHGLQPFFDLASSFMNTVQPKSLSKGFPNVDIDNLENYINENQDTVINYEIPIMIASGVGVLFMLLMPLIGFCFCCCRCCGKCGGKMYQDQKAAERHSVCCFCSFILLLITILMLCGVLFMFVTNNRVHSITGSADGTCKDAIDEVMTIGNQVIQTLDQVKDEQVPCAISLVKADLRDAAVRDALGSPVQKRIDANVSSVIDKVISKSQIVTDIKDSIDRVENKVTSLKNGAQTLVNDISNLEKDLKKLVTECKKDGKANSTDICTKLDDIKIETKVDFSDVPDISSEKKKIQDIIDLKIVENAEKARKIVKDIPMTVVNKSKSARENIKTELDKAQKQVDDAIEDIQDNIRSSLLDKRDDYASNCKYLNKDHEDYKYENYRYYAYIGLSCMAALIVLLLGGGLTLGACGYKRDVMPSHRSKTATCGGNCLMAAVGFMFMFSFVLMLFCVIWFAVGIHFHIVCRDLHDGDIIDQFAGTKLKIKVDGEYHVISVKDTLKNCRDNQAIYQAIGGDRIYDLSKKLNISEYTKDMNTKVDFKITDKIMNDDLDKALKDLMNSGVDSIDFAKFKSKLSQPLAEDIQGAIDKLDGYVTDLRSGGAKDFAKNVEGFKNNTIKVKDGSIKDLQSKVDSLKDEVNKLETLTKDIKQTATELHTDLLQANHFIVKEVVVIIDNLVTSFADRLLYYLEQVSDHLIHQVKTNVMKCKPVANLYDGIVNTFLCKSMVQNVNGFWLALGWCLLFFIPSIIFSVHLAKYYRRMDYEAGYDHAISYPPYNDQIPLQERGGDKYPPYNPHIDRYEEAPPPYTNSAYHQHP